MNLMKLKKNDLNLNIHYFIFTNYKNQKSF